MFPLHLMASLGWMRKLLHSCPFLFLRFCLFSLSCDKADNVIPRLLFDFMSRYGILHSVHFLITSSYHLCTTLDLALNVINFPPRSLVDFALP